jgi:co-chaperonin GroES (HSP10)
MIDVKKLQPVNKNLIVKMINTKAETTKGGIIISHADSVQEKIKQAKVVAVDKELSGVEVDDVVFFQETFSNVQTFRTDPTDPETELVILPFTFVSMIARS